MGIMVYSLLWVMQDFDHQSYDLQIQTLYLSSKLCLQPKPSVCQTLDRGTNPKTRTTEKKSTAI